MKKLGLLLLVSSVFYPALPAQTNLEEASWDQVVPDIFIDPQEEDARRKESAKKAALRKKQREDELKWRKIAEEIDKRQQEQVKVEEREQPILGEFAEEAGEDEDLKIVRERMIELRQEMRQVSVQLRMHRSRAKYFGRQARRLRVANTHDRNWAHQQARQRMRRVHELERDLAKLKEEQDLLVSQLVN